MADTSDQRPLVVAPGRQIYPRLSPNGRFLAYRSDEEGSQIYLTRFPSGEGKWQVSTRGGTWPRWSPEGDRLFYFEGDVLAEVPVEYEPSLAIGSARKLFATDSLHVKNWGRTGYDVAPRSERFLLIRNVLPEGVKSTVTLVRNWSIEFEDGRDR
jgi:hypothetical protein